MEISNKNIYNFIMFESKVIILKISKVNILILVIPSHPKPEKDFAQVRQNGISYKTQFMVESFRINPIEVTTDQMGAPTTLLRSRQFCPLIQNMGPKFTN